MPDASGMARWLTGWLAGWLADWCLPAQWLAASPRHQRSPAIILTMLRRAILLLLCLTLSWQAVAAGGWPGDCCPPDAGATSSAAVGAQALLLAASAPTLPLPQASADLAGIDTSADPDCCDCCDSGAGWPDGCPGALACHAPAWALPAVWPQPRATAAGETTATPALRSSPPQPLAVVWRPPIQH